MNQNQNFKSANKPSKLKPFVSFLTLFGFLLLALSGFILYIRPEGSLARWVGWRAMNLDKSGWEAIHLIFCALFVLAGITHLVLNFKAIVIYLTTGIDKSRKNGLEMALAAVLVSALLLTAVWRVPPASWLTKGRSVFKNNPGAMKVERPFPDFEKQPLRKAAEHLGLEPEETIKRLEESGIKVESIDDSLEKIARENALTPQAIYLKLK